ncbi:MAG: hypothetical protein K2Y14_00120 [Burkholderiales bacterium]|nr:hypothetical protein [Burkholderiales bacterium]
MFNSKLKKEAFESLEYSKRNYERRFIEAQEQTVQLFETRQQSITVISKVENFVNLIANKPKKLIEEVGEIHLVQKEFNDTVKLIQKDHEINISTSSAATTAVGGAALAALGPTAAMAVATTFGTAGTGAAISTLAGGAATNAALAWLGGGTLAAGGGGMAGGSALVALAGPVGWAAAGVGAVAFGLFKSSSNKKKAEEAERISNQIDEETKTLRMISADVIALDKLTQEHTTSLNNYLPEVIRLLNEKQSKIASSNSQKNSSGFIDKLFKSQYAFFVCAIWFVMQYFLYKDHAPNFIGIIDIILVLIYLPISWVRTIKARKRNKLTSNPAEKVNTREIVTNNGRISYNDLSDSKKEELGTLVNNTLSLAELISKKVTKND